MLSAPSSRNLPMARFRRAAIARGALPVWTVEASSTCLRPNTARQTISTPLNKLRRKRLVDYTVLPPSHRTRAWYLTGEGARVTRDLPALQGRPPYPISSAAAASLKTPHTLTVLRTHLTFAADARRLGHEHGHL